MNKRGCGIPDKSIMIKNNQETEIFLNTNVPGFALLTQSNRQVALVACMHAGHY